MAITLGTSDALILGGTFQSVTGDEAQKRTLLNGAASDADIITLLGDMESISNAAMLRWKWGGRKVLGLNATPQATSQNLVSAFMQLNFRQPNTVNAEEFVEKSWTIPAYVDSLRDTDNTPIIDTPADTTPATRLGRIVAFLEDNLVHTAADGTVVVGGWEYVGGGFGTGADFIDGL
jgi:hypothetical protein